VTPEGDDTDTDAGADGAVIAAAGALPWRRRRGKLQVALVHRPRYDDWSWAKGKLDPGEEWPVAAVREVFEETGLQVRLGRPLPVSLYSVADASGRREPKEVRYWAAEVIGGDGSLLHEIDEVVWLDVEAGAELLSYDRDREQLVALIQAYRAGTLTSWPLVIVRHANAYPRSTWSEPDPLRPLDDLGRERADALVPLLAAYGVKRVVTSPSVRCLATVLPYAVAAELKVRLKPGLSEESFAEQPEHAPRHLNRLLHRGTATVISSHGPVLPTLLEQLADIADPDAPGGPSDPGEPGNPGEPSEPGNPGDPDKAGEPRESDSSGDLSEDGLSAARRILLDAAQRGMGKGEALVAHVVGTGAKARVVDVEVYPAP
jgi:8-oxo-dGTP diphosphatase